MTWEFAEMDRLRGELAAVHAQIEEYKAMAVARSEQLASALKAKEEAERDAQSLRALLTEWSETELDYMDEEYQQWIDSFTARVSAAIDATREEKP
jgi:hypothetical protein